MKKILRNSIIILLAGAIVGTLLLAVSFMLPVRAEMYQQSMETLESEGWYPAMPVLSASLDTHFHSYLPGVLDGNTDRIMIETALDTTGTGNPLYRAMDMYSKYIGVGYSYYWHGYVSILRPLMLFFDYEEIRIINGVLQSLLIGVIVYLIYQKKGMLYTAIFLTSYFMLMPVAVGVSLQFSWVFYISMIGCLIVLKYGYRLNMQNRSIYFFLIQGMITCFMDLLTYPLYTWAIPLLWWIVTDDSCRDKVRCVIETGLAWITGYGGMWILKWCLGTFCLERNVWESAINEVFARVGMEETQSNGIFYRLDALWRNWKHYSYKLYFILLIAWLLFFAIRSLRKEFIKNSSIPAFALIGCSAVVWYAVLANHTSIHHFFTYRLWGIAVLAVLLLAAESTSGNKELFHLRNLSIWVCIGILAAGLSLFSREEQLVLNGYCEYELLEIPESGVFKTEFIPTFSAASELYIGLDTQSQEGIFEITLYKDGLILDQKNVAMTEVGEKNFYLMDVDWKLNSGEVYELVISAKGNSEKAFIMMTVPEKMPLVELKNASVDGCEVKGQLMAGITYRRLPGKKDLLFIGMTWVWIMVTLYMTVHSVYSGITGKIQRKEA